MSAGQRVARLQFFLRSGGSFIIDGVEKWLIGSDGDRIASLELTQQNKPGQTVLQMPGIALSEIAAIVRLPLVEPGAMDDASIPAPCPDRGPGVPAGKSPRRREPQD